MSRLFSLLLWLLLPISAAGAEPRVFDQTNDIEVSRRLPALPWKQSGCCEVRFERIDGSSWTPRGLTSRVDPRNHPEAQALPIHLLPDGKYRFSIWRDQGELVYDEPVIFRSRPRELRYDELAPDPDYFVPLDHATLFGRAGDAQWHDVTVHGPLEQYGEPQITWSQRVPKGLMSLALRRGTYRVVANDSAGWKAERTYSVPHQAYTVGYPYPKLGSPDGVIAVVALPSVDALSPLNELYLSGPTFLHLTWHGVNRLPLLLIPGRYDASLKSGGVQRYYSFAVEATTRPVDASLGSPYRISNVPSPGAVVVALPDPPDPKRVVAPSSPAMFPRRANDADPYSFPVVATRPKFGINSGIFIYYANPISPPYKVQLRNGAVFINGVQVEPPRWVERSEYNLSYLRQRADAMRNSLAMGESIVMGRFSGGETNESADGIMAIMLDANADAARKIAALRVSGRSRFSREADAKDFVAHFSTANWKPGSEDPLPKPFFEIDFAYKPRRTPEEEIHSPYGFQMIKALEPVFTRDGSPRMTRRVADLVIDPRFVDDASSQAALDRLLAKAHSRTAKVLVARAVEHIDDHRHIKYPINGTMYDYAKYVDIESAYARPLGAIRDPAAAPFLKACHDSESRWVRKYAEAALTAMGKLEAPTASTAAAPGQSFGLGYYKERAYPLSAYLEFKDTNPAVLLKKIAVRLEKSGAKLIQPRSDIWVKDDLAGKLNGYRELYEVPLAGFDEATRAVAELGLLNTSRRNWVSRVELDRRIDLLTKQLKEDEGILQQAPSTLTGLKEKLASYQWMRAELAKRGRWGVVDLAVLRIP